MFVQNDRGRGSGCCSEPFSQRIKDAFQQLIVWVQFKFISLPSHLNDMASHGKLSLHLSEHESRKC